jgi:glycosyltransferase involved in cell wall biosynthesis
MAANLPSNRAFKSIRRPRVVVFNNMITPYTNRLYNEVLDLGIDIRVVSCTVQESNRSWAVELPARYAHRILPGWSARLAPNRYAHFNIGVGAALNQAAPDLLFINGFYPSMLTAAMWASRHRTPMALTIDGWRHNMPVTPYHAVVRPALLRRSRVVVTCGRLGYEYFSDEGVSPDRIFIVPLVPAWDPPVERPHVEERPYDLLWVAQMNDEVKNMSYFVDLAIELKKRLPNLAVRLVGRGPAEQGALQRLSNARIHFRHESTVDWRQMAEVYTSAKVLALPSLSEPWGLVCNEAMQCGTPCIVSPFVGAANDLVLSDRNGLVCNLDVTHWADKICWLMGTKSWTMVSSNAVKDAAARTLGASAAAFVRAIEKSLGPLDES